MIRQVKIQEVLTYQRLQDLLEQIRCLRIGVLGDFTLDGYWYADMTRSQLSREAPLYPRPVIRETYSCGGAANVAWNLCDLGLSAVLAFTILGEDWRRALLEAEMRKVGTRIDCLVSSVDWMTPFFGKVILTAGDLQQEDSRVDFINLQPPPPDTIRALLAKIESKLSRLDGMVIADYQQVGVITAALARAVNQLVSRDGCRTWVVDSRDRLDAFVGMVLKPNDLEAARLLLPGRDARQVSLNELAEAGLERLGAAKTPMVITLGAQGCLILCAGSAWLVPAAPVAPPIDTVGAGDTFLAALASALAAGASPLEAGCMANLAAAVTVRKLRITGSASPAEIRAVYEGLEGSHR